MTYRGINYTAEEMHDLGRKRRLRAKPLMVGKRHIRFVTQGQRLKEKARKRRGKGGMGFWEKLRRTNK